MLKEHHIVVAKIKILLVLTIASLQYGFSQTNDTLYFDANWKKTTKANHMFYRPLPLKKVDSLLFVQDFYKNGNMQMQGYVYSLNENKFAGDVYWYHNDGTDASRSKYINTTNAPLAYYHHNGTLWKTNRYEKGVKTGTIKLYNRNRKEIGKEIYKEGVIINDTIDKFTSAYYAVYKNAQISFNKNVEKKFRPTKALYWMDSGKLASVKVYNNEGVFVEQTIYERSGKLIKHYEKNDFLNDKLAEGSYHALKTTNGFVVAIDSTSQVSQQHQVVNLNAISAVVADKTDGDMAFYKKTASDAYSKLDFKLLHQKQSHGTSASFVSHWDSDTYTNEDLFDKDVHTVAISQIKTQSVAQLFESLKLVAWGGAYKTSNRYNDTKIDHRSTFKLLNNYIFSYVEEAFTTKDNGGFGSYIVEDDDAVEKWRIQHSALYMIRVFMLNGNKPILVLSDDANIAYYIIPTSDNRFIVNFQDREDHILQQQSYETFSNSTLETLILYSNSNAFYNVIQKDEKYYATNAFNEVVIEKAYDSLQLAHHYIIGRNESEITIYNSKLQKLPLENVQQVYYDNGNLQVLTTNRHFYSNALGHETKRKSISYSFCGTVSSTDFTLVETKGKKPIHAIKIRYGGLGRGYTTERLIKINNLDLSYTVTFLNKTKQEGYDGNSSFVQGYKDVTGMLLVNKNGKFGLYSYQLNDVDFKSQISSTGTGIIPIETPKQGSTNAKELLPVIYDAIEFRNPLLVVKRDNAYGIYPSKEGLKYKTLGDVHNNFMAFETLEGKKGWIDVHTLQEFPAK